MALIGNQLASSENNSYRVLDNLASFTLTFDGSSSANVLASTDTIALSQHPFVTGQRVTYSSGGGSPIGGLLSGTAYYITKTDQNSFKLATSYVNSITNINIDLVGPGTGVTHSFNVAFDGVNTKFKATYSNGTKCTISRAAQLDIAINGVVQQPYDSNPPPNGFTIEADATIVFSTAPLAGYTFWGKALSGSTASFETSDNSIDNFTGNGSTTNFTLSKTPANSQNVLVTINGVTQYPSDATGTRSYSTNANVLAFTAAPANGSLIQVRYIGFAGATTGAVTGFYGRTGNVVLDTSDNVVVGSVGINTTVAPSFYKLQVHDNFLQFTNSTEGTGTLRGLIIGYDNTSNSQYISSWSRPLVLNTSVNTAPLVLQPVSTRKVGIGSTIPNNKLDVIGDTYISGNTGIGTTVAQTTLDVNGSIKGVITTMTSQVSTAGTSITFTGIPSWAKRVTVMFNGVSTNGTSVPLVQLGDSGGIENTGYTSNAENSGASGGAAYTTGFGLERVSVATMSRRGIGQIVNVEGNTWVWSCQNYEGTSFAWSNGLKTLSATLDRVRITTVNGTDTFDAGSINVMYEG